MGLPGLASWWMVMPLRHSAACCTAEPMTVAGPVAPVSGMETSSAGTPVRAQSIRLAQVMSLQSRGGEGQTSKTARGSGGEGLVAAGDRDQQVVHDGKGLDGKGAGDDRFAGVAQEDVEAIPVGHVLRDVAADDGGGDGVDLGQHLGQPDIVLAIGSFGNAGLVGAIIGDLDGGRARVEVDVIAAVVDGRVTVEVVEVEGTGNGLQRSFGQGTGDAGDAGFDVDGGPGVSQQV